MSISPTDSISQRPSNSSSWTPQQRFQKSSAAPPPGIDRKRVIWSIEDARASSLVGMTKANYSRPPMQKAIRHPDGTALTTSEYRTILGLGKEVIREVLQPLPEPRHWDRKRKTKTYYTSHHASSFNKAVHVLEQKEVLLSYCNGSWKAEHVLMGLLQGDEGEDSEEGQPKRSEVPAVFEESQPRSKGKRKRSETDGKRSSKRRDHRGSKEGELVCISPLYSR